MASKNDTKPDDVQEMLLRRFVCAIKNRLGWEASWSVEIHGKNIVIKSGPCFIGDNVLTHRQPWMEIIDSEVSPERLGLLVAGKMRRQMKTLIKDIE